MEAIGGKMVEILYMLLLLGFRGWWLVCSPFWKKYQKKLYVVNFMEC